MKNDRISTFQIIKVILIIFIVANAIHCSIMYFLHETAYIKEVLTKTGISALLGIVILSAVSLLETAELNRWKKKSADIFSGEEEYRLLKCSSGYYQLPVAVAFIDIMIAVMFFREFGTDTSAIAELMADKAMISPFLTLSFFHIATLFTVLYYCCRKVCYTKHSIYAVLFLRRVNIPCEEIKRISCHVKGHERKRIVIETDYQRLVLRSDVLSDGWNEFEGCLSAIAESRNIPIYRT